MIVFPFFGGGGLVLKLLETAGFGENISFETTRKY